MPTTTTTTGAKRATGAKGATGGAGSIPAPFVLSALSALAAGAAQRDVVAQFAPLPDGYRHPADPATLVREAVRRYRFGHGGGGAHGPLGQRRKALCVTPTASELFAFQSALHAALPSIGSKRALELAYWCGWSLVADLVGPAPVGVPTAPLAVSRARWVAAWPPSADGPLDPSASEPASEPEPEPTA